jgi:hypothetical protein
MLRANHIFLFAVAACCQPPPRSLHVGSLPEGPPRPEESSMEPNPACVTSLLALVDGRWSDYTGLAGCTRRDLDEAFGASEDSTGELGPSRRWSAPGESRRSIEAIYTNGKLVTVLVRPRWTAEALAPLGPWDEEVPSGYAPSMRQRTWAGRGLIAHVDLSTNQVWTLAAFGASSMEAIRGSPMYRLGGSEHVIKVEPIR